MICKNCGFHNEKGDEFCGSCGQYLEWTGVEAEEPTTTAEPETDAEPGSGPTDTETEAPPERPTGKPTERPTGKPIELPTGVGARPTSTGDAPVAGPVTTTAVRPVAQPDVICWNCKTRNKAGRTFCLKCGERLTTGGGGGRGRLIAILIGIAALVLLIAAGAIFFFGGTPAPSPSPTPPPPTPSASPTVRPTTSPSTAPTPTPTPGAQCASSAEPVRSVELNRTTPERRSGAQTAWCIRDVTFVERRGEGTLRLMLTNPTAFPDAPDGTVEWLTATMPDDFDDAREYHPPITYPGSLELVPAGTTITLVIDCQTDACNGRAHIAYDRVAAP